MKKSLLYLAVAIIIGVLVTLVPLFTLAALVGANQGGSHMTSLFLDGELRGNQGLYDLRTSRSDISDLVTLSVSFVIALAAYLFVKHRMPNREYVWVRIPPY
jgi:hypothetical protein